jgi:hypothetical protein
MPYAKVEPFSQLSLTAITPHRPQNPPLALAKNLPLPSTPALIGDCATRLERLSGAVDEK